MAKEHDELTSYCPTCKKAVKVECKEQYITNNYYPPIYNSHGININPDKNSKTSNYTCTKCNSEIEEKRTNGTIIINGENVTINEININ